jgi:hypothetical protein
MDEARTARSMTRPECDRGDHAACSGEGRTLHELGRPGASRRCGCACHGTDAGRGSRGEAMAETDEKPRGTWVGDDATLIEPKTYEEAMAQNARLRDVVDVLEREHDCRAAGVFMEFDEKDGLRLVVCSPTSDELALTKKLRFALADVVDTFLAIGRATKDAP